MQGLQLVVLALLAVLAAPAVLGSAEADADAPVAARDAKAPDPNAPHLTLTLLGSNASKVAEVVWLGADDEPGTPVSAATAIVRVEGANSSAVWRHAADSGWTKVENTDGAVAIVTDPYSKEHAYVMFDSNHMLATRDSGKSFASVNLPGPPTQDLQLTGTELVKFHPEERDWLLVVTVERGVAACGGDAGCSVQTAQYTSDGGRSWRAVAEYAVDCLFGWRQGDFGRGLPRTGVFCAAFSDVPAGSDQGALDPLETPVGLFMTPDWGATRRGMFNHVLGLAVLERFLMVLQTAEPGPGASQAGVVWATADGESYAELELETAGQPAPTPRGFTVLDTAAGSVFLDVDATGPLGEPTGRLFVSNANGTVFVPSLNRTERDAAGNVAFGRVAALEGRFLANQRVGSGRVSVMSVDDGRSWQRIAAPAGFLNVVFDAVHADAADQTNGWSASGAPGVVFVLGRVGKELSGKDVGPLGAYLSRDGGVSWAEVWPKGMSQLAIANDGALLVGVASSDACSVRYSWDDGKSVGNASLFPVGNGSDVKCEVVRLTARPDGRGLLVHAFATNPSGLSVTTLDWTTSSPEKCSGTDIKEWRPSSSATATDATCYFGERQAFHQRRMNAKCALEANQMRPLAPESPPCTCSRDDFECDVGFVLNPTSQECRVRAGLDPPLTPTCVNGRQYNESGYRRTALTHCAGGVALEKPTAWVPCGGETRRRLGGGAMAVVVLVLLLGTGLVWYTARTQARYGRSGAWAPSGPVRLSEDGVEDGTLGTWRVRRPRLSLGNLATAQTLETVGIHARAAAGAFVRGVGLMATAIARGTVSGIRALATGHWRQESRDSRGYVPLDASVYDELEPSLGAAAI